MNKTYKKQAKTKNNTSENYEEEYEIDDYNQRKKWFEEIEEDPNEFPLVTDQVLIELKEEALKCYTSESAHYNIKNKKSNTNLEWMKVAMTKGTASDKIAARTVSIQDNPIYSLETLRNIVGMVKVGKKKECTSAIDVLSELFLSDLLRYNKKLKAFGQRPLSLLNELSSGNAIKRRKLLSVWYFEDQLKEIYASFVFALNHAAQDTVEHTKEKALCAMYKLLAGNPEQEKNLLSFLVNKLGDPSQKIGSKAIYSLTQLLFKHPNMQGVVLNEVERLLFRPNISTRAQYYSLCFLSQYYLSHERKEIAERLIQVYFAFFKACIRKGDIDSRMMSSLLTGVNRAYPYAKLDLSKISNHINTMYRVVHMATFNISLHALTLLYQVSQGTDSTNDRFYSALYKKLLEPSLLTTTHQAMFLNLIYKSLLNDQEVSRVKTFVKRLLQIALYTQPAFSCGILYLISQLMGKRKNVQSVILKQSSLNIIDEDDDSEEKYFDIKQESDEETSIKIKIEDEIKELPIVKEIQNLKEKKEISKPSWYHCQNTIDKKDLEIFGNFNPLHRNPLYAGGEFSAYNELILLKHHFHPSISLFSTKLLKGQIINYSGDCLKDFTLIRFLDRFVFKNPKKLDDDNSKGAHPTFGIRKLYQPKGLKSYPINSMTYLNEKEQNIPVDELFMYRYLQTKIDEHSKETNKDNEEDLESVGSDEFEDMLDKISGFNKENEDDEDLDFLGNFDKTKTTKKQNKNEVSDESDEELEDDELNSDDDFDEETEDVEDMDGEEEEEDDLNGDDFDSNEDDFDQDIDDLDDDDDDDEMVFDSDLDQEIAKDAKKKLTKKLKNKSNDINSLFASADEFASLLEDEGTSKYAPGGSNVFANKDKAAMKQIAWEDKRNQWIQNYRKDVGKRKQKFGKTSHNNKNKKFKK